MDNPDCTAMRAIPSATTSRSATPTRRSFRSSTVPGASSDIPLRTSSRHGPVESRAPLARRSGAGRSVAESSADAPGTAPTALPGREQSRRTGRETCFEGIRTGMIAGLRRLTPCCKPQTVVLDLMGDHKRRHSKVTRQGSHGSATTLDASAQLLCGGEELRGKRSRKRLEVGRHGAEQRGIATRGGKKRTNRPCLQETTRGVAAHRTNTGRRACRHQPLESVSKPRVHDGMGS